MGKDDDPTEADMLHCNAAKLSIPRTFTAPARCPYCADRMLAPIQSEFVEGGEIRHHWECDGCGEISTTMIPLDQLRTPTAAE
jgi:uncharacterized protein with PIN domain